MSTKSLSSACARAPAHASAATALRLFIIARPMLEKAACEMRRKWWTKKLRVAEDDMP